MILPRILILITKGKQLIDRVARRERGRQRNAGEGGREEGGKP